MSGVEKLLPKRRGRRADESIHGFGMFPSFGSRRHFIYLVGFKGSIVKVGMTRNPRSRITSYWRETNGEVLWAHVFEGGSQVGAKGAEFAACEALSGLGRRINRSEWFECEADKQTLIVAVRAVIGPARERAHRWDAERNAAAARSAKAFKLLAEHEAAATAPAKA